jgi:hypothetical protein
MRNQWELCGWKGTNSELEKRQDSLAENCSEQWEQPMFADHSWEWMSAVQVGNCNSITDFCFTLDKVGVLEYSRSVTQKIDL